MTMLNDLEVAIRALQAIAWRLRETEKATPAGPSWSRKGKLYAYMGELKSCAQLAAMVGIARPTMNKRLQKMPVEDAVALGRDAGRLRPAEPNLHVGDARRSGGEAAQTPTPNRKVTAEQRHAGERRASAPAPPTRRPAPVPSGPNPASQFVVKPPPVHRAFEKDAQTIVPADVKRTVSKAPLGRFEAENPPSVFGRIGEYAETGTAVARSLKQRGHG